MPAILIMVFTAGRALQSGCDFPAFFALEFNLSIAEFMQRFDFAQRLELVG